MQQQSHGWHYEAKAVQDAFVVMAQRWQCSLSGMMEGEAKTRVVTLKKTRVRNNEVEGCEAETKQRHLHNLCVRNNTLSVAVGVRFKQKGNL